MLQNKNSHNLLQQQHPTIQLKKNSKSAINHTAVGTIQNIGSRINNINHLGKSATLPLNGIPEFVVLDMNKKNNRKEDKKSR